MKVTLVASTVARNCPVPSVSCNTATCYFTVQVGSCAVGVGRLASQLGFESLKRAKILIGFYLVLGLFSIRECVSLFIA